MNQLKHIRLDKIKPPDFDTRLFSSQIDDDELRDSIKELGVLEPILVKEVTDGFEIIFGNRRFHEAGRAGLAAVPCIVCKTTGAQSDKMKIHENLKRLPLSHVDQAYTFAYLIKTYNMTESQISILVGKSISYISQHLSLLSSDPILVASVQEGRLNFSIARELVKCKDPDDRLRLMKIVEENGASSVVVQNWVRESNRETDLLNDQTPKTYTENQNLEPQIPMYPCASCEVPTSVVNLVTARFCPICHKAIFTEIAHEKHQALLNLAVQTP